MTTRRDFLKVGTLSVAGLLINEHVASAKTSQEKGSFSVSAAKVQPAGDFTSKRPPVAERKFTSEAVEKHLKKSKARIKDPKLAWMFENCYPNTLDTTCEFKTVNGKPDTFVITGDIHAMWLRDSGAQVWPYVQLANEDPALKEMLAGVINRQWMCINIDPYANAFNDGPTGSEWKSDLTDMKPELHERKWEIDSPCYPLRLAYHYWQVTGDTSVFGDDWLAAITNILKTFREQQRKDGNGPYKFQRRTERATDTLPCDGLGNPVKPVGLIASSFRPSDDATTLSFLIPSNFFAVSSLRKAAEILKKVNHDEELSSQCIRLADEVEKALKEHAVYTHPKYGPIYAFEVDGFGNHILMDDANVPSLLAMPYLLVLFLLGVAGVLWGIGKSIFCKQYVRGIWPAGIGTVLTVLALLLTVGYNHTAYYPSTADLQSSLTIANSCSSPFTLEVMSYVSILVPFVLGYIFYAWRALDLRKISGEEMQEKDTHAY